MIQIFKEHKVVNFYKKVAFIRLLVFCKCLSISIIREV